MDMKKIFISLVLTLSMVMTAPCTVMAASSVPVTTISAETNTSKGDFEDIATELNLPDLIITEEVLSDSNDLEVRENKEYILEEEQKIQAMNIDELNVYIDSRIANCKFNNKKANEKLMLANVNPVITKLELKAAWLAAAQAAKLAGYPCSAKLIEYSVLGISYNENNGSLFHDKIVKTVTFNNFLSQVKNGTKKTGVGYVLSHSKNENKDLYYSLHSCTYTAKKSGSLYNISVYDKYDFAIFKYDSIFTGIVNNWAWLCQNTGILHTIDVNISFSA